MDKGLIAVLLETLLREDLDSRTKENQKTRITNRPHLAAAAYVIGDEVINGWNTWAGEAVAIHAAKSIKVGLGRTCTELSLYVCVLEIRALL